MQRTLLRSFFHSKCTRVEDSCPLPFLPMVPSSVRLTHRAHRSQIQEAGVSEGRGQRSASLRNPSTAVFTATAAGQPAASVEKAESFRVGALVWLFSEPSWPGSPRHSSLLNDLLNVNKYDPAMFCPCNHLVWPLVLPPPVAFSFLFKFFSTITN